MNSANSNHGVSQSTQGIQKVRQTSSVMMNQGISMQGNGTNSQYTNFMKQVANNQSMKNPMFPQGGSGHSRNYQNNLGTSSKTHSESLIYNHGSSMQMGGSFNQQISQSIHGGLRVSHKKTLHHQGTGNHSLSNAANGSMMVTSASGRPITSNSGKVLAKKKHNNMSDPHQSSLVAAGPGAAFQQ
jgi:hypothetical protein